MSRILLVDDSPHAQRMGERILSDEGYEVVTVSNADSALIRLDDVDPDVVVADTVMPGRTGYEICQYVKMNPRLRHVRVILTAGVLESFDDERSKRVESDGTLKKPFEATALLAMVKPLAEAAAAGRESGAGGNKGAGGRGPEAREVSTPFVAVVDCEQVRAAVTVALDGSMDAMVEEITRRVLTVLQTKSGASASPAPPAPPAPPVEAAKPPAAEAPSNTPIMETVRRVNTLRVRSGSILGLDTPPAGE